MQMFMLSANSSCTSFPICIPFFFFLSYCIGQKFQCIRDKSLQLCLTLSDPMDCSLPGSSVHWDPPGKNTRVGCHGFFQELFPIQGSNPHLL